MILLKKYISEFDISSKVPKGNSKQLIICPKCNQKNFINNQNKLTYSKIKTIICTKCKKPIQIGDIFNFKTGTKLNNINKNHNQKILDDYIWNDNYDNI